MIFVLLAGLRIMTDRASATCLGRGLQQPLKLRPASTTKIPSFGRAAFAAVLF